ncbi:hypothetical protein U1Q18_042192 [Sarracenia purpurea var. burkii]
MVSKYVYVCKCDQEVLRTLMGTSLLNEPRKMGDFDLFKVPLNGAKKDVYNEPVARDVLQKLLELAERECKFEENPLGGIEEDDEHGKINPAAKDGEKGSNGRKRKQSLADPASFNKNDTDTTRSGAKNDGVSAPVSEVVKKKKN